MNQAYRRSVAAVDIRQLRYFVAIADQSSMSLASEKLGIAQPSLSHHVMRIEEELGVQLLVRSTRGVTLTESGRRLYGHAKSIIKAVQEAVADLRDQSAEISGQVSFAFPGSASNVLAVPLTETVRHEFPKIALRALDATTDQVEAWLGEGVIDFGIVYDAKCGRDFELQPLIVEDLFLVVARDCWRGEVKPNGVAKEPVSLIDRRDLGLILPTRSHGLREMIDRCASAHNVELDVELEMDSLSRIKKLVARGSGCSILAPSAAHEEVRGGELILVPIREPQLRRTVYLATNPARPPKRAANEVVRLTVDIVSELAGKGYWLGDPVCRTPATRAQAQTYANVTRLRSARRS
jgi:LysR family transcriptional regulator, nitrogen assimilation regulatory protein